MVTLKVVSLPCKNDERGWQVKLTDLNSSGTFWICVFLQKKFDSYSGIVTDSSNPGLVDKIIVVKADQQDSQIDTWKIGDKIQWTDTIPCDRQIIIKGQYE